MEDKEPKQRIYEDLGLEGAGVSYESFSKKFDSDPEARKSVYKDLGLEQAGVDYQTFETKMFGEKKNAIGNATPTGGKVGASEIPSIGNETAELLGYKKPLQAPSPLIKQPKAEIGVNNIEKQKSDQYRPDGTKKDIGFLGVLKTPSGKDVTEYSVGVPVGGKEMDIPTLVPTLTEQEKRYIINRAEKDEAIGRDPIGDAIVGKAIKHAEQRIKEGKSPYFSSNETLINVGENQPIQPKVGVDKTALEDYNRTYDIYKNRDKWMSEVIQNDVLSHYVTSGGVLGDIVNVASGVISAPNYKKAEEDFKKTPAYAKLYGIKKKAENEFYAAKAKADKEVEAQSENIANQLGGWGKIVTENGNADVDKIREGVDSFLDKNGIPTDSPIAYKLRNEIKGKAEFKRIEPEIETQFDVEYKKAFGVTPEQDIKKEYGVQIEQAKTIKEAKIALEKQRAVQNEALKSEYKPEYEALGGQYKAKTEELNLAIENDPELNSFAQSLNNDVFQKYQAAVDSGQMTAEQANQEMNSPKNQDAVKAEVLKKVNEKYGKQYESAFTEYQKQINEVATRYNLAHRQQEERRVSEANQKIQSEVEKLKGQFKVSNELIERRKKAYLEAYKNVSEKQNLAKEAAGRSLNFTTQAGLSLLMGLGGGLKGYGAEFDNKTLYDIGESLESNFDIKVGESKDFSDWLDSSKLIVGTGNIIGRMAPGIALTAGAAALTKDWNLTSRLATTAVMGLVAETADMAGTVKNDVLEKTGDPAKADKAARDMWRSQIYILPLYALEGAPYIGDFYTQIGKKIAPKLFAEAAKGSRKTFGQWAKEAAAKSVGAGTAEVVTETLQEFPQNINEEAIRNGKEIGNIADQIDVYSEGASLKGLKETFVQIAPSTFLMGGTPVFVSDVYNGAKQKYYEKAVDNYVNSESISASLETSPEQYLFNVTADKGSNFAGTLLNTLYTSGKISEVEFDNLSQKMANMDAFNKLSKKAGMKEDKTSSLVGYRLYDQYLTANESFEKEQDPIAKEVLKAKADESKKNLTEYLQGSGVNVGIMTLANGQQFVFTPEELKFALQFENIRNSLKNKEIGLTITAKKGEENQSKQTIDELNEMLKEPVSVSEEIKKPVVEREEVVIPTVTLNKNTTPTEEKYGTIDRGDGKGIVDLTRAEYEAEMGKMQGVADVEAKRVETESKIKRKDLFQDGGTFSNILGESGVDSVPTNHREINGIEFVEFSNPNTGVVDVIMSGTSDSDFVGFYRIYENGKPTDKWSSKFENQSRNKENFKTMISGVQEMLPEGHEYTEKTSISTDGLRVWNQQLSRGYDLQYDNKGNLITNRVAINGDAINNELGITVNRGNFENVSVTNNADMKKVKEALLPYLQKFGLNESNIHFENGTVEIDLPVLKNNKQSQPQPTATIEPTATEEEKGESSVPGKTDKAYQEAQGVTERISKAHPEASVLILPKGDDLSLTALYVGKEKRGKGIGSGVLESVKTEADKLGKKIVLDATNELDSETDLERLGNFYERNGFEKVGENKFEYTPKETPQSGSVGVGGDVESTTKALEGKDINIGNSIDVFRVGDNKRFASNNEEYLKEFIEDFPERSGDKKIRKEKIIINKPYEVTLSKYEFSDEAIETKIIKKAKKEGYDGVIFKSDFSNDIFYAEIPENKAKTLAEAYHKAKADGSNPELVKAVEQSLKEAPQAGSVGVGGDVKFTAKGGNKVVDEKGEPLVVYHGTNKEFDKLDADKPQRGLFFTKDKQSAKGYANKKGDGSGTVREAKISLKNPHIIDAKGKSYDEIIVDLDKVDMATGKGVSKKMTTDEIVDALRGMRSEKIVTSLYGTKEKADGIIIKNVKDNFTKQGEPTDIYIPFSNEQISEQSLKETPQAGSVGVVDNLALKDVESTAKALEGKDLSNIPRKAKGYEDTTDGTVGYGQREQRVKTKTFKVAIDGYGSVSSQSFIEKLVSAGRLGKEFLSKKTNRFTDEFYNEQFNKNIDLFERQFEGTKAISEAYHKAKKDGSNPELVKAVEEAIGKQSLQSTPPATENEKITQEENGQPLPEGVSGVRTETEERKTSAELRAEEKEVRSTIDNAVANFYAINEATKRSEKREAAKEFRQNLEKMPTVKNVFDNIKSIFAQLEAEGIITKSKDCP